MKVLNIAGLGRKIVCLAISCCLTLFTLTLIGCNGKADVGPRPGAEEESNIVQTPDENEIPDADGENTQKPEEEKPSGADKPSVALGKDVLVCSTTSGLKVRSGAGTGYKVIGSLDKGDMLAYASVSDGWYKVAYRNGWGYVSSAYLKKAEFEKGADAIEKVISEGKKVLGTPYVFGAQRYHWGNGVKNSAFTVNEFDCSSLMQYIFKLGANVNLDTTSRSQSLQGRSVKFSEIKRGDLLFFTNDSRKNNSGIERIGHVALYLGDNHILHTASDFAVIEEISPKRQSYFISARRLI